MRSKEAQTASSATAEVPPHCGPFSETAPFPETAPHFALIHLPRSPRSPVGRARARASIRDLLATWANAPVELHETPRGPEVSALVRGHRIFLSLSYTQKDAWVAIGLDQRIGLDAVWLGECEGWEDMAPIYLGREITHSIANSDAPQSCFARHWAALEARCKCSGVSLQENAPPPQIKTYSHTTGDTVLAVAFEPVLEPARK